MRKTTCYLITFLSMGFFIYSCSNDTKTTTGTPAEEKGMTNEEMVSRGKYIISTSGCNDCHTPKIFSEKGMEPDMSKMLSGHPSAAVMPPYDAKMVGPWILFSPDLTACVGPWGTSYSANLTPSESGLGNWTEEQFMNAIRNGKHMGLDNQRPIMPPMPWQEVRNFSDDDLKSIFAFLRTIPPVENVVPAYQPPSPM